MCWTVYYNKDLSGLEVETPYPEVFSLRGFHPELTRVSWPNNSSNRSAFHATPMQAISNLAPSRLNTFLWPLALLQRTDLVVKRTAPHPVKQCCEFTLILPSWNSNCWSQEKGQNPFIVFYLEIKPITDCGMWKTIYNWSLPSFQHRVPKTFMISRVTGRSFVIRNEPLSIISEFMLMRWLTLEEYPDNFRMGLAARRKTNHQIRGLEFLSPIPKLPERERGADWAQSPMANDLSTRAYLCNETLIKCFHLEWWGLGELHGWWIYWCTGGRAHPDFMDTEVPVLGKLWDLALSTRSCGRSFVSFVINSNLKYSVVLSSVKSF